jgi:hypothetical protein
MNEAQKVFRIDDGVPFEDLGTIPIPAGYTHMSLPAGMQIVHKENNRQEILGARTTFKLHYCPDGTACLQGPGVPDEAAALA